jgi:hypothetical protein
MLCYILIYNKNYQFNITTKKLWVCGHEKQHFFAEDLFSTKVTNYFNKTN